MKELSVVVLGDGRWARALTVLLTNNQNRQRGHIKRVMQYTPPRAAGPAAPPPRAPDRGEPDNAGVLTADSFSGLGGLNAPLSIKRPQLKADSEDATMMAMTMDSLAGLTGAPPAKLAPAAVHAESEDETLMGLPSAALAGLATSPPDRPPQAAARAGSEDATMMGMTAASLSSAMGALGPEATTTIELKELGSADLLLLTVPAAGVRALLRKIKSALRPHQIIIHCVDGICPGDPRTEQPSMLISDVIRQETQLTRIGALAGPVLPEDLEEWNPAAVICGSPSETVVAAARQVLGCPTLRIYGTSDLVGVEVARAMSSVIALASGVCDVMEFGAATRATLVSRSAAESARLGMALGAHERTFLGLAGFGGFMLASERRGSSDFELGRLLGASIPLAEAQKRIGRHCDSVDMVRDAHGLAESHGLRTPILTTIHNLLFSKQEVPKLVKGLLEDPTWLE